MSVTAMWNGTEIASSNATIVVEGNHYFPLSDVQQEFLQPSDHHTVCSWKGTASYYDIVIGDASNKEAAWFYPEPLEAAQEITNYVAFWKGVEVSAGE